MSEKNPMAEELNAILDQQIIEADAEISKLENEIREIGEQAQQMRNDMQAKTAQLVQWKAKREGYDATKEKLSQITVKFAGSSAPKPAA